MKLLILCICIGVALAATTCKYKGRQHSNGEVWVEGNFKVKCTVTVLKPGTVKWKAEVIACMTPSGTAVSIGQQIKEGGKDYKCEDKGNGNVGLTIHSKTVSDTIIIH